MDLQETVRDMLSKDYRERFKAEYQQLAIRCDRLKQFLLKIESDETVKHDCPESLLRAQYYTMCEYLHLLEQRSTIEHIEL